MDDMTPGQDNFSSARLAGGFRLHCIADGHGPGGHWVSDRVVRILPYFLSSRECRRMLCRGDVESALKLAFERMQADLVSASQADGVSLVYAGTTAICILRQIHSPVVWVACVGDSRVIHLCGDGRVSFSTNDHKPSNPVERERVLRSGCEITVSIAGNGEELAKIVPHSKCSMQQCNVQVLLNSNTSAMCQESHDFRNCVFLSASPNHIYSHLTFWKFVLTKCVEGEVGRAPELGFTRSLGDLMWLGSCISPG